MRGSPKNEMSEGKDFFTWLYKANAYFAVGDPYVILGKVAVDSAL